MVLEGFSGADLASLLREAGLAVVREWREKEKNRLQDENLEMETVIYGRHFEAAFERVKPSVSPLDRKR